MRLGKIWRALLVLQVWLTKNEVCREMKERGWKRCAGKIGRRKGSEI